MDISEVKAQLNHEVIHTDRTGHEARYILSGCIIRRDEERGRYFYQAELTDLRKSEPHKGKSILICKLEDVRRIE